jgi:hypothetical protein
MKEFPFLSMDDIDMNININLDSLLIFFNNDYNDYMSESTETLEDPDPDYIVDSEDSGNFSSSDDDYIQ